MVNLCAVVVLGGQEEDRHHGALPPLRELSGQGDGGGRLVSHQGGSPTQHRLLSREDYERIVGRCAVAASGVQRGRPFSRGVDLGGHCVESFWPWCRAQKLGPGGVAPPPSGLPGPMNQGLSQPEAHSAEAPRAASRSWSRRVVAASLMASRQSSCPGSPYA